MKLLKRVDGVWYLVTSRGTSTAVRRIDRDAKPIDAETARQILRSSERTWDARDLWRPGDVARSPASRIPFDRLSDWQAIAVELERSPDSFALPARPIAPNTPLRDLCAELRTAPRGVHDHYLVLWREQPDLIARRFLESVDAFADYTNDEPFVPPVRSGKSLEGSSRFAREVVRIAHQVSEVTIGGQRLRYVGYEVSPRRTTGATRDADTTGNASGLGGIDLVLTDGTGLAVVEIKAATDTTLLLALVQGLMYAAELVSEHQRVRLATYGADPHDSLRSQLAFLESASSPFVDVILLCEAGSSHLHEADAVLGLAQTFINGDYEEAQVLRQHVRSIALAAGAIQGDELLCERIWNVR